MRAQIALEFLIVISFVIIVFLFLFFVISSQRTNSLSSQSFSQLQLVSQSIALQLYKAYSSGNGYSAQISVYSTPNARSYNVTITKTGTVILQETVGTQRIQAISYSSVPIILSNPAYLAPGSSTAYLLPVTNDTISVQDSFGSICIDYQCPTDTNVPSSLTLTSQNAYAAQFNGASTEITTPTNNFPTGSASRSVFLWIYYPGTICTSHWLCTLESYGGSGSQAVSIGIANSTTYGTQAFLYFNGNGNSNDVECAACKIPTDKWTFVGYTYNSVSGNVIMYINGQTNSEDMGTVGTLDTLAGTVSSIGGGGLWGTFSGSISNVQVYNTTLSGAQVSSLYVGGISAQPVAPSNTVGWWTLNGNTNDFSGNGNNGDASGLLLYQSVSQLTATVLNTANKPVNGILVGFTSSIGNLSGSTNGGSFNYTNANGIATTFLSPSNYTRGIANVRATVFNGNFSSQGSLAGWWPMNQGQGSAIFGNGPLQFSGEATNGVYWNVPNYAASFDGSTSSVSLNTTALPNMASSVSVFAWVYFKNYTSAGGRYEPVFLDGSATAYQWFALVNGYLGIEVPEGYYSSSFMPSLNNWNLVGYTYTAGDAYFTFYLDGQSQNVYISSALTDNSHPTSAMLGADGIPDDHLQGLMSNVQIYSTALSASAVTSLYTSGVSAAPIDTQNLAGWYPLDGNANDYSSNGYSGDINGNLQFVTLQVPKSSSINQSTVLYPNFNGTSSYINAGNSTSLASTTWTESLWADPNSLNPSLLLCRCNSSFSDINYYIYADSGTVEAGFFLGRNEYYVDTSGPIPINQWSNIQATFNGTVIKIYINGVLSGNSGDVSPYVPSITLPETLYIGTVHVIPGYYFNGSIADVQIYKTALSYSQVEVLYQGGNEGLPLANLSLAAWYPLDGNANDYSVNNNNGVATNVTYSSGPSYLVGTSTIGNYGINFNGQSSYVALPSSVNNYLSGSSFSVSAWIRSSSAVQDSGGKDDAIFGDFSPSCSSNNCLHLVIRDDKLYMGFYGDDLAGNSDLSDNTWYFVTFVYNKSSNYKYIYINGKLDASGSSSSYLTVTSPTVCIGNYGTGSCAESENNFNGTIANLQLYNTALSAQQVAQLYDNGLPLTSSVSVPTGWLP